MKGIIYLSRARINFTKDDLSALAANASARNKKLGVTGYLSFDGEELFIQYIEGEDADVSRLFELIYNDNRHKVTHFLKCDVDDRRFPDWAMQLIDQHEFKIVHDLMICHLFYIDSARSVVDYKNRLIWNAVDAMADINLEQRH